MLLAKMTTPLKEVCPKEQLIDRLKALQAEGEIDVLVMMGAGDIDRLVVPVRDALTH